jgi:hypothetical protein
VRRALTGTLGPDAQRLIVRIAPEKLYQWPPVPATA